MITSGSVSRGGERPRGVIVLMEEHAEASGLPDGASVAVERETR